MANYTLSRRAQRDLVEVLSWSLQAFGKAQTAVYDSELRARLTTLAESPNPGTPSRVKQGVFWLLSGSHVVFYRVQQRPRRARVVRILHQSRLPELHLV